MNRKGLFSDLLGNTLVFFDFIIYVYFSKYIIANFFPSHDPLTSKILAIGIFMSAYIVRPLGALYFGWFGDAKGRRMALIQSTALMVVATLTIGLLPSYQATGVFASVMLIVCRLLQGFSLAGAQSGMAIYLIENTAVKKQGKMGSFVLASSYFGVLLGLLFSVFLSFFWSDKDLLFFGWRIPFLLSVFLGVIVLILRIKAPDSLAFNTINSKNTRPHTLFALFYAKRVEIINRLFVMMGVAVPLYLYTAHLFRYMSFVSSIAESERAWFSGASLALFVLLTPVFGRVSDKVGLERVLLLGFLAAFALGYPVFYLLTLGTTGSLISGLFVLGIIVSAISAPLFGFLVQAFPVECRYTMVSFVFNLGLSIFGCTVPRLTAFLSDYSGNKAAPGIYMALSGLVGLTALYFAHYQATAQKGRRPLLRSIGVS